jgi:orotate phosphoribosyltransferase
LHLFATGFIKRIAALKWSIQAVTVTPREERSKLRDLLAARSVQRGRKFKLVSGAESDVYVDAKRTTCFPEAMPLIGRGFLRKFRECGWEPRAVGGKTLGADPIAYSIARESLESGIPPISAFVVRKEPKKHGMEQYIEGLEHTEGLPVVIVDDVCTKGGSTGEAIEKARKAGMSVIGAMCLVDREEGATEFLASQFGCRLESIFKLPELLDAPDREETTPQTVGLHG